MFTCFYYSFVLGTRNKNGAHKLVLWDKFNVKIYIIFLCYLEIRRYFAVFLETKHACSQLVYDDTILIEIYLFVYSKAKHKPMPPHQSKYYILIELNHLKTKTIQFNAIPLNCIFNICDECN